MKQFSFFIIILLFVGCTAPLATVKQASPHFASVGTSTAEMATAENQLNGARKLEQSDPSRALGQYLASAQIAFDRLRQRPDDMQARQLYNFSVARTIETIERANLRPWQQSIDVATDQGHYSLTSPKPVDADHDPDRYDLVPADTLTIGGKFLGTRTTVAGVGAPLVAIGRTDNSQSQRQPLRRVLSRTYAPVTAILRFRGRQVELELLDPLEKESVSIGAHQFPLAADFTAPTAIGMSREHPEKFGFARLINPEKSSEQAQLMRLQQYDSNRIPVILVHGLGDAPVTWVPMINTLRNDPEIRRRYQFWFYTYPSGFPYPYTAAILRDDLDAIDRAFPDHKDIVVIGHSMGGTISRLLVTDVGDRLWHNYFGKTPAETNLPEQSRKVLEKCFIFHRRTEVKRVIFISAPHRGSVIASNWIGRFGTTLVRMPRLVSSVSLSAMTAALPPEAAAELKHVPTSIDTLSPKDRFVIEVNNFPVSRDVPFHTIEGDRGRGDAPNSSDGVVPYWSSHLDGAQSELIVPSDHRAQRNPQAIAEVRRILRLHH